VRCAAATTFQHCHTGRSGWQAALPAPEPAHSVPSSWAVRGGPSSGPGDGIDHNGILAAGRGRCGGGGGGRGRAPAAPSSGGQARGQARGRGRVRRPRRALKRLHEEDEPAADETLEALTEEDASLADIWAGRKCWS